MSHVSRSVYQKVVEENKQLIADIKVLVGEHCVERAILRAKWTDKFKDQKAFGDLLKEIATKTGINNPDMDSDNGNANDL